MVPPDLQPVADSFFFLSAGRPVGFAPGPIPLTEIIAYAQAFPLSLPFFDFVELMRMTDIEYLNLIAEKNGPHKDTRSRH